MRKITLLATMLCLNGYGAHADHVTVNIGMPTPDYVIVSPPPVIVPPPVYVPPPVPNYYCVNCYRRHHDYNWAYWRNREAEERHEHEILERREHERAYENRRRFEHWDH